MFVPVSCTSCGKPFQVPESALGKLAPCPWCQAVVTALPVSVPVVVPEANTQPEAQPAQQPKSATLSAAPPEPPKPALPPSEPLSLDDTEPSEKPIVKTHAEMKATGQLEPSRRGASGGRPELPKVNWAFVVPLFASLTLLVLGTAATLLWLSYGSGRISEAGWTEFTPADGSFSIKLPGAPQEEDIEANPIGSVTGGKRYVVRGWYSKTAVWVAYNDLDPALVPKLAADRDRVIADGVLQAERDRERRRLEGTITQEFTFRHMNSWSLELYMDTPRGKVVEWLIVVGEGAHPRVYAYGIEAKDVTVKSPAAGRLNSSFKLNN
jgi:hypothetical protein